MCEVLRALVKCGGLFFMSIDFIPSFGMGSSALWYDKY